LERYNLIRYRPSTVGADPANTVGERSSKRNPAATADVALPRRLRVVVAVAHDMLAAAIGTLQTLRPTRLPNEFETFGFAEQAGKIGESRHGSNLR